MACRRLEAIILEKGDGPGTDCTGTGEVAPDPDSPQTWKGLHSLKLSSAPHSQEGSSESQQDSKPAVQPGSGGHGESGGVGEGERSPAVWPGLATLFTDTFYNCSDLMANS